MGNLYLANEYRQFSYHPKSQIFHSKSTTYLLISLFFQVCKNKKHLSPRYFQIQTLEMSHWLVTGQPFAVCFSNILGEYIFTVAVATSNSKEWHWLVYSKIKKLIHQKRGWDCSMQKLFWNYQQYPAIKKAKLEWNFYSKFQNPITIFDVFDILEYIQRGWPEGWEVLK